MEMLSVTPKESSPKGFVLPSPQFDKLVPKKSLGRVLPHFLSAQGMLLPRKDQPPPMYGPRGATVPAKFLTSYLPKKESKQQTLKTTESEYQKPGLTINRAIQKPPKQVGFFLLKKCIFNFLLRKKVLHDLCANHVK